ncbi:hypothetical protein PGTUg99_022355 [Puccinia graminis f. sp. tritici]|uniref:Uncharacterized protein n=1 Tax=Puccinia graminis f. sp. tritici TaxID=56615 RepID=A0A5B0SC41_PUCGR|nr:hypothetical protein PGTUg99_022355 [Puccinia graminis f. sp. tritici]
MCHSCSRPQAYRGPAESGVSHAGSNFRAHEIRSGVHGRNLGYSMIWKSDEPKRENDGCLLRIRKGRVVLMSHRIVYVLDPFPASNNLLTRTYLKKAYNHLRTS